MAELAIMAQMDCAIPSGLYGITRPVQLRRHKPFPCRVVQGPARERRRGGVQQHDSNHLRRRFRRPPLTL